MYRNVKETKKEPCTHCGRTDCIKLGDEACTAERKRMWEELRRRIDHWEAVTKRMK